MKIMKNNFKLISFVSLCLLMIFASCKQDNYWTYIEHDATPPGEVSNIKVEPLPGGAVISYDLPKGDLDLLYVMAKYEIRPGVKLEASSSFYDNSLVIHGFGDIKEHDVELYTVDRSGNRSKSVIKKVIPLKAPVIQVYDSLEVRADFGGIRTYINNPSKENLMVGVMIRDEFGDWKDFDAFYTGLPISSFAARGLKAVPTEFGIYIRDRWMNYSDTLVETFTPLHEEELDKSQFSELSLPGDGGSTWSLSGLWDGGLGTHSGIRAPDNNGVPAHYQFQISKNNKMKISRFKMWGIIDGREYSSNNIREFEIWGSNDPGSDGEFDSWILMGSFEVKKPSGLPDGEYTEDDRAQAQAGDDFDMPFDAPAVKYIRLNVLSTFSVPRNSETGGIFLTEMSFWGQAQ